MYAVQYETVAASQTDQVMGPTGGAGDYLKRLIVTVATAATGTVVLQDSASGSDIPITAANTPIGVYNVEIDAVSVTGAWLVTTGAGASVIAVGRFR
jgi:hypothetical protein